MTGHCSQMSECVREDETGRLRRKLDCLVRSREALAEQAPAMDAQKRKRRAVIEEVVESEVLEVARKVMELGPKFIPGRRMTK